MILGSSRACRGCCPVLICRDVSLVRYAAANENSVPLWDRITEEDRRMPTTKAAPRMPPAKTGRPGRNDPCPCGSGRKYKQCCLEKDEAKERAAYAKAAEEAPEPAPEAPPPRARTPKHQTQQPWRAGSRDGLSRPERTRDRLFPARHRRARPASATVA